MRTPSCSEDVSHYQFISTEQYDEEIKTCKTRRIGRGNSQFPSSQYLENLLEYLEARLIYLPENWAKKFSRQSVPSTCVWQQISHGDLFIMYANLRNWGARSRAETTGHGLAKTMTRSLNLPGLAGLEWTWKVTGHVVALHCGSHGPVKRLKLSQNFSSIVRERIRSPCGWNINSITG